MSWRTSSTTWWSYSSSVSLVLLTHHPFYFYLAFYHLKDVKDSHLNHNKYKLFLDATKMSFYRKNFLSWSKHFLQAEKRSPISKTYINLLRNREVKKNFQSDPYVKDANENKNPWKLFDYFLPKKDRGKDKATSK